MANRLENGFEKADSSNLPSVDEYIVYSYMQNNVFHCEYGVEALLNKHCNKSLEKDPDFSKLTSYCAKPIGFQINNTSVAKWDFYNSVFFVITVVSTIGYGNLAPTTTFSRLFMIFYGLIGIPMNGIVMVTLGDYFGKSFTKLYRRWKTTNMKYDTTRLGLISQVVLYSIPGFTFFIILPSVIMIYFEKDWTYDMAVYYSFVTLTTIGFGDLVAATENTRKVDVFYWSIYKIFLLVWIIGGLGYVVMILGFITRGMRSKKIKELEHKIANNIKKTPYKIRSELRMLLNEFLLMKVKRIYKHDFEFAPTGIKCTQSCPDLTIYRDKNSPTFLRKRAFSECPNDYGIDRVQSDTDLHRIDKEMTFQPADALMQQKDLLLKVVDALSYVSDAASNKDEDMGIQLFSDSEILASERHDSAYSINSIPPVARIRRRAKSEVKTPVFNDAQKDFETTWYGQAAKELQKRLTYLRNHGEGSSRSSGFLSKIRSKFKTTKDDKEDVEKTESSNDDKLRSLPSIFVGIESEKKPTSSKRKLSDTQTYLQNTRRGRMSAFVPENKYKKQITARSRAFSVDNDMSVMQRTRRSRSMIPEITPSEPKRKSSILSADQQQSVLENTSLADFIRALSAITVPEVGEVEEVQRTINIPQPRLPTRSRRLPIRSAFQQQRRSSLMPSPSTAEFRARRLSLTPVEENNFAPPPPYTPFPNESRNGRFTIAPTNTSQFLSPFKRSSSKTDESNS